MKDLIIEEVKDLTPSVECLSGGLSVTLKGDSSPEDAKEFYAPILRWVDDFSNHLYFAKDLNEKLIVDFNFSFEYINSTSSKFVYDMLKMIYKIAESSNGKLKINITWYYDADDEDMMENGDELKSMLSELMVKNGISVESDLDFYVTPSK